jgi:hypothetical protein
MLKPPPSFWVSSDWLRALVSGRVSDRVRDIIRMLCYQRQERR